MRLGLGQAPGAAFPWLRDRSSALQLDVTGGAAACSSLPPARGGLGEPEPPAMALGSP